MQLSGPEIKRQMRQTTWQRLRNLPPNITIKPFDEKCLGSNSYDLHLDKTLLVYETTLPRGMRPVIEYRDGDKLSMRNWFLTDTDYSFFLENPELFNPMNPNYMISPFDKKETIEITIPESGLILSPLVGYLGATVEYTETFNLFPYIDGKSSIGRNFILTHHTAGRGDDGFCGRWTLEINTVYPTLIKPNMRIGQMYFDKFIGKRKPYGKESPAHYNNQMGAMAAAAVPVEKHTR